MAGDKKSYEQILREVAENQNAAGTEKAAVTTAASGSRKSFDQIMQELAEKHGTTYKGPTRSTAQKEPEMTVKQRAEQAEQDYRNYLGSNANVRNRQAAFRQYNAQHKWDGLKNAPMNPLGVGVSSPSSTQAAVDMMDPKEMELKVKAEYYRTQAQLEADNATMMADMAELEHWSPEDRAMLETYVNQSGAEFWKQGSTDALPQMTARAAATPIFEKYGAARIKEIAESYTRYHNQNGAEETQQAAREMADKNGVLHSALSVGANLANAYTGPLGYLQEAVSRTGRYSTLDPNNMGNIFGNYASAVRSQVAENISGDQYDEQGNKVSDGGWLRQAGAALYEGGMSAADSLARIFVSGGNETLSLGLAATGSFSQTVSQASAQGANPVQAVAMGIVDGGLEVLTEKVSLDNLFKQAAAGPKSLKAVLKAIFKTGAIEVSEEELSFLGSTILEAAILREKSSYKQKLGSRVAQGESYAQARMSADLELLHEAVNTAVTSFLSGGLMGGGAQVVSAYRTNKIGKSFADLNLDKEDVQDLIDSGLESDPETESYQISKEVQKQISEGKTPSNYDLARLWQANAQAMAEEEAERAEGAEILEPDDAAQQEQNVPKNDSSVPENVQNVTQTTDPVIGSGPNVTQQGIPVTENGANVTAAPLGVAARIRQEQNLNGGNQYGTEQQQLAGSAAVQLAGTGTGLLHGSSQWYDGQGTAEPSGSMAGRTGQAAQRKQQLFDQQKEAVNRRNRIRSLRLQKVSSADLGIQSGTDVKNIQLVPQEHYDTEMGQLAERIYQETGKEVSFVMGAIQIRGADGGLRNVNGVVYADKIVVRADHLRLSMEQIADHEAYHGRVEYFGDRFNQEIRRHIIETFSEEELRKVLDKYVDAMSGIYDNGDALTGEDFEQLMNQIQEEVFADAYAGINAFGAGADRFTSAVNEKMEQLGLGRYQAEEQANGVRETNGPPTDTSGQKENTADYGGERYSIDERFENLIDSWDGQTIGFSFVVGETSDALQEAGVPKKQIRWDASKIKSLLAKHNGMTLETVKQIPELLEHPIIVIDSKKGANSKIVMGDLYDEHGKIVTAVLLLTPTSKKGNVLDILKISSAEGRSHIKSLFTAEDGSIVPVRYVDKKRIQSWLNVNRLQLPLHNLDSDSNIIIDDPSISVKKKSTESEFLSAEEFRERYGLKLPGMKEIQEMYPIEDSAESQTFGEPEKQSVEKYSVDDEYDTTDFASVQAAMNAQSKEWGEMYLRDQLGDDGYEKYRAWEKEQQAKKNQESQERAKQRTAEKQAVRKSVTKPVAESRPVAAKRELRGTMMNIFSIPDGSRAELGDMIDSYADRLLKNGALTEEDRKHFFDRMYDAGVMTVPAEDYFSQGREILKGGRVNVPESVRADFGDDWNNIRRRAFGARIYFTSDPSAGGIDMWNQELAEQLPGLFDSEETDLRSILERIVEIAEEGKDEKMSLAQYTAMLAEQDYVSEDEFLDNMERQMDWALRTFAEKARLEVKLRDRTGVQIAKERAEHQEMARRQRDRKELRELQEKTLKSLRWLNQNRNRAPEELREEFEKVLGDIDLYAVGAANEMRWSDRYNATWKNLAQMYKDAMQNDPNFMPSKELEMIVARLDGTKIEDMDLGALNDLYKAAIGLRTEFYNRNNVISDEMQRLFEEVYTDAKQEIETAPGKYTGKQMEKFLNLDQLTPMNVLQRMGGWDPNGAFYSMAKQLEKGERDMRAYSVKAQRMLQDFLTEHEEWVKKADGQGKDGIWYEVQIPELIALEVGKKPEFGATITVSMTPAQKVHMYLESKNVDNLRHMTGGRTFADKKLYSEGKRQEALAQGKTVRMAPETVKAIVSDLTAEEMELARLLEQYYNSFATQEINRISNILYGYDKAMGRNYAPIYTNRNYTKAEFGVFDTTAEGVGNLKGRQYAVNPSYNISAFDAFERHVDQTARFVGMAIPARNWTTLMNWRVKNNSTGDVITHKWGEEGKRYITDLITTLQAGDDNKTDTVSSTISKLQSTYITAIFGANPSIVLKQLGSIPLASAYLDAQNIPSPAQIRSIDRELIGKYTQDLQWRTMGYSMPETKELKENPNWTQTNKFYRFTFGGGAITAMDGWAASVLWPWAENKVRREYPDLEMGTQQEINDGVSPFYKKVAELFEDALSRSQSTSDEIHQSSLRKSRNPITRAFTMFRSDSAQTYNVLRQKIGEAQYYARTGAKPMVQETAKKAVGAAFISLLLNAMWSESINFLMALWKNKGKYYRDDEEELTFQSVAGEMVSGMLGSFAGIVTGGEELLEIIGNLLTGEKIYDIETPGIEQLNNVVTAVTTAGGSMREIIAGAVNVAANGGNVMQYLGDNSRDMLGCIKELAETVVMYLPGLPASGLPVSNIEAYMLGAVKWLSPELGAAYDDVFQKVGKSDLSGMEGGALESRVSRILRGRNVSESDETAQVLAALYEEGYKTAVPSEVPASVTIDGEKYTLNTAQQQKYGTVWSGIVADALDDIVASDTFADANPDERSKLLGKLYDYAAEQAKADLFNDYDISGSTENISLIHEAGLELADCIAWTARTSEMRQAQKFLILRQWSMPDKAKKAIIGTVLGTEMKTETGKSTEYAKMLEALDQGTTVNQYLDMKLEGVNIEKYLDLVKDGMDERLAFNFMSQITKMEKRTGDRELEDTEKWRAAVDFSNDIDSQLSALSMVMSDDHVRRVNVGNDFGITPEIYVSFYEARDKYDANNNGTFNQVEIQSVIDAEFSHLTPEEKGALWQLMNSSKSSRNNPYRRDIGTYVLSALAEMKAEDEEEPSLQKEIERQWKERW